MIFYFFVLLQRVIAERDIRSLSLEALQEALCQMDEKKLQELNKFMSGYGKIVVFV